MTNSSFLFLAVPLVSSLAAIPTWSAENLADPIVRFSAAGWYQQPSVTIRPAGGGSVAGSDVGLDDRHVGIMADVYLDVPVPLIPGIHAGVWKWKDDPTSGGQVSATGGYLAALWEIDLLDRVGVAFGVGALSHDLDPGTGNRERFIVPAAAARGWFRFTDDLSAETRLMYGAWSDNRAFDGVAQINWRFLGPLAAVGGWRVVNDTHKLDSKDQWDVMIGGPFLGASVSF